MAEKPDTITVASARLADAVKAAVAVAPSKVGAAFSQAAGVFLEIFRNEKGDVLLSIKSTNLMCWFSTVISVDAVDQAEPRNVSMRVSSNLLGGICDVLPARPGDMVKIGWQGKSLFFRSGKLQARLQLMDDPQILWNTGESESLGQVVGIRRALDQVSWCAKDDPGPMSGVLFSEGYAWATNNYVVGKVKTNFSEEIADRFVLYPSVLSSVISDGMVFVGIKPGLVVFTSATVQVQVNRLDEASYPRIEKVQDKATFDHEVLVSRSQLQTVLRGTDRFLKEKRDNILEIRTDGLSIGPRFLDEEMGLFRNEADCIEPTRHDPVSLRITSSYLYGALDSIGSDVVKIKYSVSGKPMVLEDPDGKASFFVSTIRPMSGEA